VTVAITMYTFILSQLLFLQKKLLITHLSDHIHVHTDGTGNIISVSITTVSKAGATYLYDLDPELDSLEFITTLNVSSPSQAAV